MLPLSIGLGAGGAAALLLSGLLSGLLYETQGAEPTAYLIAAALMLTACAVASLRPALRAASSEPLSVLRSD